jgi:hypothetical protein
MRQEWPLLWGAQTRAPVTQITAEYFSSSGSLEASLFPISAGRLGYALAAGFPTWVSQKQSSTDHKSKDSRYNVTHILMVSEIDVLKVMG